MPRCCTMYSFPSCFRSRLPTRFPSLCFISSFFHVHFHLFFLRRAQLKALCVCRHCIPKLQCLELPKDLQAPQTGDSPTPSFAVLLFSLSKVNSTERAPFFEPISLPASRTPDNLVYRAELVWSAGSSTTTSGPPNQNPRLKKGFG